MSALAIRDLVVRFDGPEGPTTAVDGATLDIAEGQTVALVGESGAGKSVTARAVLGLLRSPPARIDGGEILFDGDDIRDLSERQMRTIRGARIGMIFQDPLAALNPVYSIGKQIMEPLLIHDRCGRREAKKRALELLEQVGFPDPKRRFALFPHELSGGMRQRAMIAAALACEPELLIADEPTTALDMVAARGIMDLLRSIKEQRKMAMLLISHDLGVVTQLADEIAIMYAGRIVERGPRADVMNQPLHPYTRALLQSVPPLRTKPRRRDRDAVRLPVIPGSAPAMRDATTSCRFADRCADVMARCHEEAPPLFQANDDAHGSRCFLHAPVSEANA
ncbi:MAG: ABC transporter ATP-binding protein [Polyangiaceae bacterium]